jgi:hypothetical protein
VSSRPLPMPVNPALLQHAEQRAHSVENRVADAITGFAATLRTPNTSLRPHSARQAARRRHYVIGQARPLTRSAPAYDPRLRGRARCGRKPWWSRPIACFVIHGDPHGG